LLPTWHLHFDQQVSRSVYPAYPVFNNHFFRKNCHLKSSSIYLDIHCDILCRLIISETGFNEYTHTTCQLSLFRYVIKCYENSKHSITVAFYKWQDFCGIIQPVPIEACTKISVERTTSIFKVTQFDSGGYWTFRDHDRLDAKAVNILANKSYKNGKRYTSCTEMLACWDFEAPTWKKFCMRAICSAKQAKIKNTSQKCKRGKCKFLYKLIRGG
jgi:hypothetical protein